MTSFHETTVADAEPLLRCELCGRAVVSLTVHHLVPRSRLARLSRLKKGEATPLADLCPACHRQIHALFSNRELADEFHSLQTLRAEPRLEKFLRWVRKQDPNKKIRVRK